jgi:hypothetical protein
VVHLVTRGTIEERVLRTLQAKQNLFAGVFDGDEDEIAFAAINAPNFLDAVRDLFGEPKPEPTPAPAVPADAAARLAFWQAGAQMIDALNHLATIEPPAWAGADPELRNRLHTGLAQLLGKLSVSGSDQSNS